MRKVIFLGQRTILFLIQQGDRTVFLTTKKEILDKKWEKLVNNNVTLPQ